MFNKFSALKLPKVNALPNLALSIFSGFGALKDPKVSGLLNLVLWTLKIPVDAILGAQKISNKLVDC